MYYLQCCRLPWCVVFGPLAIAWEKMKLTIPTPFITEGEGQWGKGSPKLLVLNLKVKQGVEFEGPCRVFCQPYVMLVSKDH